MSKLDVLALICSLLQILGLVLVVAGPATPAIAVLIGVCGFAAVVSYFMPYREGTLGPTLKKLRPIAAVCGLGLIVFACAAF
ncbi:MAG: hypothetical protein ABIH23_28910 [bacterium]